MAVPNLGVPLADERNPFRGKGLAVTVALLLEPRRWWSLGELALRAQVSRPLVTKVIESLRRQGYVKGDVHQGRRAGVQADPELLRATALHWPTPVVWVLGGRPPPDLPVGGGPVVSAALGVPWDTPPRAYARTRHEVPQVLAQSGGALVSEPVAAWGISIVDFPFEPGPLPTVVAALELGASPRGRETLEGHADTLLRDFFA